MLHFEFIYSLPMYFWEITLYWKLDRLHFTTSNTIYFPKSPWPFYCMCFWIYPVFLCTLISKQMDCQLLLPSLHRDSNLAKSYWTNEYHIFIITKPWLFSDQVYWKLWCSIYQTPSLLKAALATDYFSCRLICRMPVGQKRQKETDDSISVKTTGLFNITPISNLPSKYTRSFNNLVDYCFKHCGFILNNFKCTMFLMGLVRRQLGIWCWWAKFSMLVI